MDMFIEVKCYNKMEDFFIFIIILTAITEVCASVQQIYEQAGIPQVGERALVPVSSSTASVSSTALLSASPGGSDQTVAGFSKEDSWQNFENTFQRKHVTQDGK